MRSIAQVLLVLVAISTIPLTVYPVSAQSSLIDYAIEEGVQYVIRSIAFIDQSKAVIRDHPSIPITVEWNGRVFMAGGFLDPGDRDYYHEIVNVSSNSISVRLYFNVNGDLTYDIVILVTVTNIDAHRDSVTLVVERCSVTGAKLYVGNYGRVTNGDVIYTGYTKIWIERYTYTSHYSNRYVARHSTRIAAWLLEDLGYTGFSQPLHNFMNALNFTYDVYAPVFGRSNNYPDDFFDRLTDTWLGAGYSNHPWVFTSQLSLYPYKSRIYIFDSAGLASLAVRGWKEAPLAKLLMALHLLNKYGTQRADNAASLIGQALHEGGWDGYGLSKARLELDYVFFNNGNLCESIPLLPLAIQLHGIFAPLSRDCVYVYNYEGYPVYLNAVLLAALVRYYIVAGQETITYAGATYNVLDIADKLAGILVRVQWIHQQNTPWGALGLAMHRGGWPAAYDIVDGEIIVKPSAWGTIDMVTTAFDKLSFVLFALGYPVKETLKLFGVNPPSDFSWEVAVKPALPMPGEWPTIVNSESTILAIQALRLYRQLYRTATDSSVYLFPQGVFIEGGGNSSGNGRSGGSTSADGRFIRAWAESCASSSYRYQYARYRLILPATGNYTVVVSGASQYYLGASSWLRADFELHVKLYDGNWNILSSTAITVGSVIANNSGLVERVNATPIYVVINVTTPTRTIYVEVGVAARAVGYAYADIGSPTRYVHVESVKAVQRGTI
ncbi:MAG: hypothetical protein QXY82_01335 [Desulfurococcaceae archaeon]